MNKKIRLLEAADEIRAPVWDELDDEAVVTCVRDGYEAYRMLQGYTFDVVLIDLHLSRIDALELLRRIRREKLCSVVVLTSQFPSFYYAQQGILYGAFDYLLRPLERARILDLLARVRSQQMEKNHVLENEWDEIVEMFGTLQANEQISFLLCRMEAGSGDRVHNDIAIQKLYRTVVDCAFAKFPWLGQFVDREELTAIDWISDGRNIVRDYCSRRLIELNQMIVKLYPATRINKFDQILWYILEHIDNNCLQKEIAAEHFLSSTSLSEMFQRQLGLSYRSYVTSVKMYRAEYLLRRTDMKIYEISALLGYKDTNYFSRLFKQKHGRSLSEYRKMSYGMDYQI